MIKSCVAPRSSGRVKAGAHAAGLREVAERLRCDRAEFLRQYERLTAQPARGPKDELGRLTHLLLLSLQQREDLAFWLAQEVQDAAAPRPPVVGDLFDDKTQG